MADEVYANERAPTPERVVERFAREFAGDLRLVRRPVTKAASVTARLLGPFAILAGLLAGVHLFAPQLWDRTLGLAALVVSPLGEAGVPVGLHLGLPAALVVGLILALDLQGALFLLLNGDYLKRVPKVGLWLRKVEAKAGAFYAKHPSMSKAGVAGLAAFVMLPMAGTGSMSGALLGKIMGFGPVATLLAVTVGSLARSLSFLAACLGIVSVI